MSRPLELRSEMKLDGSMRLEGPIIMQMSGPSIRYDGTFVSPELYDQVQLGKTSRLWAVTVLGEPDRQAELPDGSELLVWSYSLDSVEGKMVDFLSFGGKSDEEKRPATLTTVIRFVDGMAFEKWRG